uniref:Polyprotein protein n=1 Tax=Solanum tuberosum TaxID=4113 RepID=M1DNC1_SOLTU
MSRAFRQIVDTNRRTRSNSLKVIVYFKELGVQKGDQEELSSEVETDEEQLEIRDEAVYEDMADLEGAMFETATKASLRDTSMEGFSGAKADETLGTDAQSENVTPGIDALTDGATEMQTSPLGLASQDEFFPALSVIL